MARLLLLLAAAVPLGAHMVSLSTGDILIEGRFATYELRMPLYEIQHLKDPEPSLFANIHFKTAGVEARLREKSCAVDNGDGSFKCTAKYEWPVEVDVLYVDCTFHSVTVANHVHLLRAKRGDKNDQAVLDFTQTQADLRFRPPTAAEIFFAQFFSGITQAAVGPAQILFLVSLVLAARTRREFVSLAGMFLLGEVLAAVITPLTTWNPPPRFVEAAAALTIAYLAVEILLLPQAGQRWLVASILGLFHGLYFAMFLRGTGYQPAFVLAGVALAEAALLIAFGLILTRIGRWTERLQPVRVAASLLFVTGLVWFFVRLRS